MGSIIDMIKGLFVASNEEVTRTKETMKSFLKQILNRDSVDEYMIIYGKAIEQTSYVVASRTTYYNYMIAFNKNTGEIIITDIDSKLTGYGTSVIITNDSLKEAKLKSFGVVYKFEFKDKTSIEFQVPEINSKIADLTGGYELAISQKEEAKVFKQFFKNRFNC
ncbi:MAG: hypothetical protein ACRCVU_07465 [Flavobacterium sp.]